MVPDVARALDRLGQRERFTADDDPVFAGTVGGHLDASALRRRYVAAVKRADLRQLPFHSLRHYFGSMAVDRGVARPGPVVDGTRAHPDNSPLPPHQETSRRRGSPRRRLRADHLGPSTHLTRRRLTTVYDL